MELKYIATTYKLTRKHKKKRFPLDLLLFLTILSVPNQKTSSYIDRVVGRYNHLANLQTDLHSTGCDTFYYLCIYLMIYSKWEAEDFQNEIKFEEAREIRKERKLQQQMNKEIVELNDTLDFISPYQR